MTNFDAKVEKVSWLTKKVVRVTLTDFGNISYSPGQFVMVEVGKGLKRAYGISSAPINGKSNTFELYIDVSPGGPGSKYFKSIEEGAEIKFSGPFGAFILDETVARSSDPIVFLATGTGVAPLKAMVEALLIGDYMDNPKTYIKLCLGCRYADNVFLNSYFENLDIQYDRFHFTVTLSRPCSEWTGCSGYVTEHIDKKSFKGILPDYFVCGRAETVRKIIDKLQKDGVKKEKIHFEEF